MKHYRVECGDFTFTTNTREEAEFHAKRIGLARCESSRVIAPSGEVVYEF